jgi:hypothetical protein
MTSDQGGPAALKPPLTESNYVRACSILGHSRIFPQSKCSPPGGRSRVFSVRPLTSSPIQTKKSWVTYRAISGSIDCTLLFVVPISPSHDKNVLAETRFNRRNLVGQTVYVLRLLSSAGLPRHSPK